MAVTMGSAVVSWATADFGNVSAAVAELWIKRPLTRLTPDLVFIPLCSESGPNAWKQIPVQNGTKVHFHRLPVLAANTTALTAWARSRASASLIKMPWRAATPVPAMIAVGVARPKAQGQAITRTATAAKIAKVRGAKPRFTQGRKELTPITTRRTL